MVIMQTIKAQHSTKSTSIISTKTVLPIITAISVGVVRTQPSQVPVGAKIRSIVCNLNFIVPSGSGTSNVDFYIMLRRSGQGNAGIPDADWSSIGLSDVRNQIFHTDMAISGTEDAGAVIRRFRLKIPKGFQRLRDGDDWILVYGISEAMETSHGFRFRWSL